MRRRRRGRAGDRKHVDTEPFTIGPDPLRRSNIPAGEFWGRRLEPREARRRIALALLPPASPAKARVYSSVLRSTGLASSFRRDQELGVGRLPLTMTTVTMDGASGFVRP